MYVANSNAIPNSSLVKKWLLIMNQDENVTNS